MTPVKVSRWSKLLLVAVALILTGCAGFHQEWERAGQGKTRDPFEGRWEGRWTSSKHKGSGGSLQCVLTKLDERHYRGAFRAGWLSFHANYSAVFAAERRGRELHFSGDRDLGPLAGGNYHFEGRATPERFRASYDSSYDRGIFEMNRPQLAKDSAKRRSGD